MEEKVIAMLEKSLPVLKELSKKAKTDMDQCGAKSVEKATYIRTCAYMQMQTMLVEILILGVNHYVASKEGAKPGVEFRNIPVKPHDPASTYRPTKNK